MSHYNNNSLATNKAIQQNNSQNNNPCNNKNNNNNNIHHRQQARATMVPPVSSLTILNNMEKVNMVPGFILKLWKMINDPQCDELISWSENGQSFIITDPPRFSQELSKYFKHNNLSSFIRQLNMYGFRKVATIENSGLHPNTDDLHFYHPDFLKDEPDRLEAIKRKLPQKLSDSVDLRNVYKGISEIEDKQKDVSKTLQDIKRENEMLWAELHELRQKHQQQQLYISRLMKLVFEAMEQNGIKTNMLQIKRNSPLMIEAAIGSAAAADISTVITSAASSPTNDIYIAATSTASGEATNPTAVIDPSSIDINSTVTTTPSPTSRSEVIPNTLGAEPTIAVTTMADNETHPLKKSRVTPCDEIFIQQQQNQDPQQEPAFQIEQQQHQQQQSLEAYDIASQFNLVPNDQLQSHVESTEYQIDTLVPTIGEDFEDEELNFFAD